MNPLF